MYPQQCNPPLPPPRRQCAADPNFQVVTAKCSAVNVVVVPDPDTNSEEDPQVGRGVAGRGGRWWRQWRRVVVGG